MAECIDKQWLTSPFIINSWDTCFTENRRVSQGYNEHTCVVFKSWNINKSLSGSVLGLTINQPTLAVTCYITMSRIYCPISTHYVISVTSFHKIICTGTVYAVSCNSMLSKKQSTPKRRDSILWTGTRAAIEPHVWPISCHVTSLPWQELEEELNNFWRRYLIEIETSRQIKFGYDYYVSWNVLPT